MGEVGRLGADLLDQSRFQVVEGQAIGLLRLRSPGQVAEVLQDL